jgi:hypothetical protein
METILGISIGVGLAAACGFRVFVPLLLLSVAAHAGHVQLASAFAWIGSEPAVIAFGVATALEILAYYVPWVDNFMDTIATPSAVVAGTVVTAAVLTDMSPFMQWSMAVIAGGGVAGVIQAGTAATRVLSTTTSGGLANPVVSTVELGFSGMLSLLSLVWPLLAVALVTGLLGFVGVTFRRRMRRRSLPAAPSLPGSEPVPSLKGPAQSSS